MSENCCDDPKLEEANEGVICQNCYSLIDGTVFEGPHQNDHFSETSIGRDAKQRRFQDKIRAIRDHTLREHLEILFGIVVSDFIANGSQLGGSNFPNMDCVIHILLVAIGQHELATSYPILKTQSKFTKVKNWVNGLVGHNPRFNLALDGGCIQIAIPDEGYGLPYIYSDRHGYPKTPAIGAMSYLCSYPGLTHPVG